MKIIKRNGSEMPFDSGKIYSAISRANAQVEPVDQIAPDVIQQITDQVTEYCRLLDRAPGVEEVQDRVEHELMAHGAFALAKCYITYHPARPVGGAGASEVADQERAQAVDARRDEADPSHRTESSGRPAVGGAVLHRRPTR